MGGGLNFVKGLGPAIGIAAGAVGSEVVMGYLPIPENLKTGVMRPLTKGAVGIVGGMVLSKVLKQKRLGNYFMLGAVVIAAHDFMKEMISKSAPGVKFGQYMPSYPGLGYANAAEMVPGMGEYRAAMPGFAGADHTGQTPDFGV